MRDRMKLYNTLTKKIEEFIPYNKDEVTMYTCGPTVYNYAHIGNLRTYISEDILEKTLNYLGYSVKRCMNITDVGHLTSDADSGEDKMLKGAKREKKSVLDIAAFYTEEFKKDTGKLNIAWPKIVSRATDNIPMYFSMITKLLDTGYAYQSGGNIYFDTSKLENYYQLKNNNVDEMVVGAREGVEQDHSKRNQADFVLWFTKSKFDDQELKWESPWGFGYPGWHIECSGISITNLGEYLDIHCGGVDNIFPHHTNEIAQSEAYLGHPWCRYWVHCEHLNDITGKMSKSKGEFLTVSLLEEKGYHVLAYRYLCLSSHYRKQLVFSYDSLDIAANAYQKLLNKVKELKKNVSTEEIIKEQIKSYEEKFKLELENDLNTANALTVLYDVLKSDLNSKSKLELVKRFDSVLSLDLLKEDEVHEELDEFVKEKIEMRNQAKKEKNFALADQIREELKEKGISIKDTKEGTIVEKIEN